MPQVAGTGAACALVETRFFVRLDARFSIPARTSLGAPRGGRVEGGRRAGLVPGLGAARPALDADEPGARLVAAGVATSLPSAS